jgi:hypothetical protein
MARQPRCYGHSHQILDLVPYLDVLERKPGAMAGFMAQEIRNAALTPVSVPESGQQPS